MHYLKYILLFLSFGSFAQMQVDYVVEAKNFDFEKLEIANPQLVDSSQVNLAIENAISLLHQNAYLEARLDSLSLKDSIVQAHLHTGIAYEWLQLKNGNLDELFLSRTGFREQIFRKTPFYYRELLEWQDRLLVFAENNGFPFASVRVDSIAIADEQISGSLFMNKGPLIVFDDIELVADVEISNTYLTNYLGIKKGEPFDKSKILAITDRIKELPFLKQKSPAKINFRGNKAVVTLFLQKKKASRFDFLVGVLPTTGEPGEQRILLTGQLNAAFQNQFGYGEKFSFNLERLRPGTQELEIEGDYPYVLDLPFGVNAAFNQYKRDSTFSDVIFDFGVAYLLQKGNYLKVFGNRTGSNLLTVDTIQVRQNGLPDVLDVARSAVGLEYVYQNLDYRYNPRKGWGLQLKGSVGQKVIEPNNAILAVNETLYDTLTLQTTQYQINATLEGYLPLFSSHTLKGSARGGYIFAEQPIYQNEQFRIGGNQLLRGFDEESIFATYYSVATLEYRILLGQNSFLYVFGDYAWTLNRTTEADKTDQPFGFGAGMNFETPAGIFGISVAVGGSQEIPANFRQPKLHFGYVSFF